MKKSISILLVLLMLASVALVSCFDEETPDPNGDLAFNDTDEQDTLDTSDVTNEPDTSDTSSTPQEYTFTDVEEEVYVKNCLTVNFRKTPNSSDKVVGTLKFGDGKTYKRVKYNEMWSGLDIDGTIYYVNSEYLTTDDGFVVFDDVDKTIYAVNTESEYGVRIYNFTDNTADGCEYGTVKHGAALHATGLSKDGVWYRVDFTFTDESGEEKTVKNLYIINGRYVSETNPNQTAE